METTYPSENLKTGQPRVAILGHRGIPNNYGGFEILAEELSEKLVALNCAVTVYCRKNYFKDSPKEHKGATLVYLPTIAQKFLDTPFHTLLSVGHVFLKNTAELVIMVNVGNAPFALLARLLGKKVILNVDGLDWNRQKWSKFVRCYLKICSKLVKFAANEVITDASSVKEFYEKTLGVKSHLIAYGTDIETNNAANEEILRQYHLEYKKYFFYVARFEPENNPLLVVRAYVLSGSKYPLVMIGDNRYNREYVAEVKRAANDKVIFLGYVFGSAYKQLLQGSLACIRAAEVGGISPAVIEAMGRNVCVIANDKPENREPLGDTGIFYQLTKERLAQAIKNIADNPKQALELGRQAGQRTMVVYSWDSVGYEYFKLIGKVLNQKHQPEAALTAPHNNHRQKILITGAGGMLGQAIYEYFAKKYIVYATSRTPNELWISRLDVCDRKAFEEEVASFHPHYIFHLAAMTNLEECEKNLSECYQTNALSVKYAAQLATQYQAKLVYISTAQVFGGERKFYHDNDEAQPKNVYGLTKQMGALLAEYYARDYLTIRLGWLIGGGPRKDKKFVRKIIEQIAAGQRELNALMDTSGSISYSRDVASHLAKLLQINATGTYNMVNPGTPTRFDLAKEVVKVMGYEDSIKVRPVTTDFFANTYTAKRSTAECLINSRLNAAGLDTMLPWQEALADYLHNDFASFFNYRTEAFKILPEPLQTESINY